MRRYLLAALFLFAWLLRASALWAQPVPVRYSEGVLRGFLALRTLQGVALADGDLTQVARGDQVTCRVVFHFRDGSIHDETVVFSQHQRFQFVSDHLVQKGPSFPLSTEASIDMASGRVFVRYRDEGGKEKTVDERMDLPADLANGLMFTLLKNIRPESPPTTLSMVAATPKPRLVKLVITPMGEESFTVGSTPHRATRYEIKVSGLTGLLARILGKKPPVTEVWILSGEAPTFVKAEGPLYIGGPSWRIEMASPAWPRTSPSDGRR